jgi:thiol-disulfide isomerase/thioredoxin
MKTIFFSLALFIFFDATSQVNESLKKMEEWRLFNESYFENIEGKVLPDFTAKGLRGKILTKNTIRRKKVTFINIWFVSCAPCIAEIPNLNRLYDMMKGNPDVQFFAITYEPEAQAKEAIRKYDIHFPVLLTSYIEAQQLTFGRGYPANMVLDRAGRIHTVLSGGSPDPDHGFELFWKLEIEKILKGDTLIEAPKPIQITGNKSGIVFIDSQLKIQSINALANYFKEQPIFIDLWASWCLPCREDFNSKNFVDSFLNKHKIARLFISIDNPKASESWKSLVYKYQLNGYHLLAGKELIVDIKQTVYKNEAINIPRYIIVKNGKVVELNAFRPSDGQKLIDQLIEKLL